MDTIISNNHLGFSASPFFSVIIATHNREDLIERAIESLIYQTETDWEALIVDDESTDKTHYRISHFLERFPNIHYYRHSHRGEALTKNEGVKLAKGNYVTFLDSDDEYEPIHLESRKEILLRNPKVRFLFGGVRILGNQFVPDRFDNEKKINLSHCVIGGTFFIERNTILSHGGLRNILLGTDADLYDRLIKAHVTMLEISYPTYIYHHETEDSITNKMFFAFNYS